MKIKYSLLTLALTGLLFTSCQTEVTCETQVMNTVDSKSFYADSTQAILVDCGKLDAVDMEITRTPLFTEIVNFQEFSDGKYTIKRFLADFTSFSKTDKYTSLRMNLIMKTKTYNASDWAADKKYLIGKYGLSAEDAQTLETVVTNPANASMTYPDAYQEMNKIKVQNVLDKYGK